MLPQTYTTCLPLPLPAAASQLEDRYAAERQLLLAARQRGIVFLLGRSSLRAEPGSNWLKVGVKAGVVGKGVMA